MAGAGPKDLHDIKTPEGLNKEELIRACRLAIAAELDASNFYEMIAQTSDDKLVKDVMQEVANEEKVHAGEFLQLIKHLDPEEIDKHHAEGAREVQQHGGTQGGPAPGAPAGTEVQVAAPASPPAEYAQDQMSHFEEKKDEMLQTINEEMEEALEKELTEDV